MVNGKLDFGLILFNLGKYLIVIFAGYLCTKGFIQLVRELKERKIIDVEHDTDYYEKKLTLAEKKIAYRDYVREHRLFKTSGFFVEDDTDDEEIELDPEEVDIPTLDELIAEEGEDFLKHSDEKELLSETVSNMQTSKRSMPFPFEENCRLPQENNNGQQ